LLTTTHNSRILFLKDSPQIFQWLFLIILGSLLSGCVQMPAVGSFFELTPESAQHRAMQTRMFETSDEKELISASAAVLQDLGFQLEESSKEVGVLIAAKERGAREFGQEIFQGFIMLLGSLGGKAIIIPVDMHQQINASLVTRQSETNSSQFSVRILFYRSLWKGDGNTGNQHIPPGELSLEIINDAEIYQQFFAKLSKSVFLEAHQI
jgi:hypothetical protein